MMEPVVNKVRIWSPQRILGIDPYPVLAPVRELRMPVRDQTWVALSFIPRQLEQDLGVAHGRISVSKRVRKLARALGLERGDPEG